MARRIVESPPTGETFIFDDDWNEPDGRVRRIEYVLQPGRTVPAHFHPGTAQSFAVTSGVLTVTVNGKTTVLGAGDEMVGGPGDIHAQRNDGDVPVVSVEGYDPPIDIEPFFTVLPHAVASGNPLKMGVFFGDFLPINANVGLPLRIMIAAMAPLGRLFGFRRWYRDRLPVRQS